MDRPGNYLKNKMWNYFTLKREILFKFYSIKLFQNKIIRE